MASSGPEHHSDTTTAWTPHDTADPVLPSLDPSTGFAPHPEPYTSNDMSAAETLAALSDSRPSTSHAVDNLQNHGHDGGDNGDEGGILLHNGQELAHYHVYEPYQASTTPQASIDLSEIDLFELLADIDNTPSFPQHAALDHHAAAFEALSMAQDAPLPPTLFPPAQDPDNSTSLIHTQFQDYVVHAYEDHLSLQDSTAFMSPHLFYLQTASHKEFAMGLEESEADHLSLVTREDLAGEERDHQGIIWSKRMLRRDFRQKRTNTERARLHKIMKQYSERPPPIPNNENFFSFRRMDKRHRPWGPHFQLRNMMAVTSRQDIYYAKRQEGVFKTDASGSDAQPIIDTSKHSVNGNMCMITTLAAMDDVVVAGGFDGEYAVVDLRSTDGPRTSMDMIRDWAPETKSFITNHVHLFKDRHTYTPQAILSSNDHSLRVLDCATNTFKYKFPFKAAVNCSATSPDGRLRVVAGDFPETLITNAETGETLQTLSAHEGDAFACAWADDGIHVASAAQDGTIAVWDARTWRPLALLPSELSIPRVLKFSPVGSGPRVLVSAEADDYVSIINATTFASKQTFDFFGQTGGVDFTPDGQSLFVANSEYGLGGIIELERAGGWNYSRTNMGIEDAYHEDAKMDWGYESDLDDNYRVLCGATERDRWGLDLGSVDV